MHRFYLPPRQCEEPLPRLAGNEAHHALQVLRLQRGDRIAVLDGAGHEFICELGEPKRREVELNVVEKHFIPSLPCEITLLQAIPKGKIIENIIQKATELGVARVVPLLAEHVVTRLDAAAARQKADAWQQVAIEAIKQSGNAWLPKVETPITPQAFLARGEQFEMSLIASLHDQPCHLREHLRAFAEKHERPPRRVCVWVGPEGDFTTAELDAAKGAGALPITLGRLVLRVETATTFCLAILNYELQEPASS